MSWAKSFQANIASVTKNVGTIDLSSASGKLTKQFSQIQQSIRETTGGEHDITELPEDYLALERRVDALRAAHQAVLKITKTYDSEGYDYPSQINETFTEFGQNVGHSVSSAFAAATRGTNLPQPGVVGKAPENHKTLAHALSRSAATSSTTLAGAGQSDRLAKALQSYAAAQDRVGTARLQQDQQIAKEFNAAWSAQLTQINAAMKGRANVKAARLALDACRSRGKGLTGSKAEQNRLETEQAEENLVNATEEAIMLMRSVLESPSSLSALVSLVKAQQAFHAKAAETLAGIQADIEESATVAEGEFRKLKT